MAEYCGRVLVPKNVVITRERGCQFGSGEYTRLGVRCGSVDGLNSKQTKECQSCINFYFVAREKQQDLGAYQSVYAGIETY